MVELLDFETGVYQKNGFMSKPDCEDIKKQKPDFIGLLFLNSKRS